LAQGTYIQIETKRGSGFTFKLDFNREQRVIVGQSYSDVKHVKAGVPQGSVLGPLLFLVYVNDITQNLLSIARLFADDTSLASTTSNIDDLQGIINHALREISKWSNCELFRKSFMYSGAAIWNSLPLHVKNANSVNTFKCLYLKWKRLNDH